MIIINSSSAIDSHTFGTKNNCSVPLEVTFSVERCRNCLTSSATKTVSKVIEPNCVEFLMHVRREDLSKEMTMNHEFKFKELDE